MYNISNTVDSYSNSKEKLNYFKYWEIKKKNKNSFVSLHKIRKINKICKYLHIYILCILCWFVSNNKL